MLKIYFYLKSERVNERSESSICTRIRYKQQSLSISTGKYISKERWDFTNKLRNVLKLEKEKVIRRSLDLFHLAIEKKFNDLIQHNTDISLLNLRDELKGKKIIKENEISIIEVLQMHIEYFRKKVSIAERSKATLQKYERSKELLMIFTQREYDDVYLASSKIDSPFIYNLESYLKYESNFKGRIGIKNNSVVKYMRMYKTAFNYAVKMYKLTRNPFDIYEGKLNIKNAVYLTPEELKTIETKKFGNERLEKVKDIFLFCCYTGYAPIDASSLTVSNLVTDNNNDQWIQTNRAKTSIRSNVPILPPVQKIIKKYKDQQTGLIPQLSNQKMNEYLKEIAILCKIDKNLTWYAARHTFATTVTLGNGVRIENVSSMMGHTNILQTQHYAKVLDSNVKEDMNKLIGKYKN
ncbi:site-specific recombinase XerD [Flavobacterium sp. 90]|uniref:site-specific integrase n=1 Tax=unclassified Flavobacterium TaxID=196869 RepID=UPI000EAFAD4C|nr:MULTISPECIES: site-specific integrase [unclassified Flavobacterium]RKR08982.1 site-specific recombinase XerD [Flavobacterium sp. 81]TCK52769.1 site-specific recombinase XerD [Flavobacterium sp. 90]